MPGVRDDCFAGEVLLTLDDAQTRARTWCLDEYGLGLDSPFYVVLDVFVERRVALR